MNNFSDLHLAAKIDLAHEPAFDLGEVKVRPTLRQLVRRSDGAEEVVEPRIMQVLVALARAEGKIVTRDELIERCWQGRIVGEDAINRAISRLRRLADGIGRDSFRLETVTKVGYRLVGLGDAAPAPEPSSADISSAQQPPAGASIARPIGRRKVIAGSLALASAGVTGLLMFERSRPLVRTAPSPAVEALMTQAMQALDQSTREGQNQSFGLLRRVVALRPDYPDGWGTLGLAYAIVAPYRSSAEGDGLRMRATEAARRALALDGGNARGQAVFGLVAPALGGWLTRERRLRLALSGQPDDPALLELLASTMCTVGRWREAVNLDERSSRLSPTPAPGQYFHRIQALWGADRLEDADRLITEATALFPTHFAIWFARFYILIYSGRVGEAIALGENRDQRPSGIETAEFESVLRVARAMASRETGAIDAVMREQLRRARRGAGYAENTMQFASALGRLDDAFAVAGAYYFSRGFEVPEIRFTREQGTYTPRRERLTTPLFMPSTVAMRADARFDQLVRDTGLTRYWRISGTTPDYVRHSSA